MDRTNFTKEAFHDIYPRLLLRRKVGHFLQQAKSWIRHFPSNSRTAASYSAAENTPCIPL
jgi:hypothetical protein